uniref:major pollen allergen Ole e 10-like n=1 Tax=Fragaria vesca subsp. vesca TaxID=101020 RepID=UPI0005CB3CAA|nr:PREDICTED: major pollen allergen Ole e 10-like [Fragaria vesca subsp. vesca]
MTTITKLVLTLFLFQLVTTAYSKGKGAKPGNEPKQNHPGKPSNIAKPNHTPKQNQPSKPSNIAKPNHTPTPGGKKHNQPGKPDNIAKADHTPTPGSKKYCVASPNLDSEDSQHTIDAICNENKNVDCRPVQKDGVCYNVSTKLSASYALNAYYVAHGREPLSCKGQLTTVNPSEEKCIFP